MGPRAAILDPSGTALSPEEHRFFREADPWGFILFARSIENPAQVRRLVDELREAVGRQAPVLVDQEGGTVQRFKPPHWRRWQPVSELRSRLSAEALAEALHLRSRLIAHELRSCGLDVNCVPMLDVPSTGVHAHIGDRVLGTTADEVIRNGRAVCEGTRAGGVLPVIKHMPGHGRTLADSHDELPVVAATADALTATDFAPFRALAGETMGMTCHVVFEAFDETLPATHSPTMIRLIREEIGFKGLLMTDDLSMNALQGSPGTRALTALEAGVDIALYCNGTLEQRRDLADKVPRLSGAPLARARAAEAARPEPDATDIEQAERRYTELTGEVLYA